MPEEEERRIIYFYKSYRITENINLPFKIMPVLNSYGDNRIEVRIKVKLIFSRS
jgi:AP-2 complex subunit mu-1